MAFQPKQITHYEASHLAELQGDVSETAIKYSLGLIPPFSDGDAIHDNACGSGAVTTCIMESLAPGTNIHIDATDINPQFVEGCAALAKSHNWPVSTAVMSAQQITFPADHFTHSITSFAFHCLGDHDTAAKNIYRTLKPGGIAIASIWVYMPHVEALQHAHWRTRGKDGPMPALLPLEGFQEADLRKSLETGGFIDITCSEKDCFLKIGDMKRWAQLAWSYLGALPSGWSQNDEDKWDEAIADIVEQLKSGDGISKNDKGETVLRMVCIMAVAKK
ncbi:S-adenosyl-L-methionine-dependent methyltransferase [Trematosphaeria pertusa]|uniref:S-adenosyl-L-methionine-dependent methyltransferase n=1 Tax=Trematosphaeria pertusa TaxID=390896 RepID=A0A6A6I9E7_9PLEO|nr:S-adenosyl-L-methionine-dependent methyltransferase [Trematosphaeria pertusa]KAF2246839.1 S-adenosyl-L-methionine-dependent methyltransferase [Trematosphaeria pertusa]